MLVGNEVDVPLTGELPDPEPTFFFDRQNPKPSPLCRPRLCASRRSDPAVHRCARLCRILASKVHCAGRSGGLCQWIQQQANRLGWPQPPAL